MTHRVRAVAAVAACLATLVVSTATLRGDEFRPAYLQLTQVDLATYDVLWKLPALDEDTTLKLRPAFPDGAELIGGVRSIYASGTAVQRWRMRIDGGLEGKPIEFSDLSAARIDVLVRLVRLDGTVQLERLPPVSPVFVASASPGALEVVRTYTLLGIEHILAGIDHLLFVLALVLLVQGTHRLIGTITAFTVAHSLTLAGATLGFVRVPGPPVEACIALSIVFVAGEIVHARQGRGSLTARAPWVVAFTFGLLHGFGFAGALAEIGLPAASIPVALLFFNVGVEAGQLLFVAVVLALGAAGTRLVSRVVPPAWLWRIPPYAIGSLAAYWTIERLAAF